MNPLIAAVIAKEIAEYERDPEGYLNQWKKLDEDYERCMAELKARG